MPGTVALRLASAMVVTTAAALANTTPPSARAILPVEAVGAATASVGVPPWKPAAPSERPPAVCFAPGTPPEEIERGTSGHEDEASAAVTAPERFQIADTSRWSATATDGCCLSQGEPTTLTYSFVPDGTSLPGGIGEPAAPSDLFAFLDGIYGSPAIWMPLFHQVFARWSELTGIRYVFQPSDDGAALPSAPGAIGVRGDVRIAGHYINGDGGVIAYNWFPGSGDMVLDTGDGFFAYTGGESLLLRNVVAHEHGHGIGLRHSCPLDHTKLMEPIASLDFWGPQHDEVLGGQRGYGDPLEADDTPATAIDLGAVAGGTASVAGLSIDDDADVDLFRFRLTGPGRLSAAITPVGLSYPQGPQNADGSCGTGTTFDSRLQADLALDLLAADATTVLATADDTTAGWAEQLDAVELPEPVTYYLRVRTGTPNAIQLYDLDLELTDLESKPDPIFSDGFESGDLSAWSGSRDVSGQLGTEYGNAVEGERALRIALGAGAASYVVDRSPTAETRYRARFYLDATSYVPPTPTARVHILKVYSKTGSTRVVATLSLRVAAGGPEIQARVRRDDGRNAATSFVPLPLDAGAHAIEIDWRRSSAPGADDGRFEMWVDGASTAVLDRLDNDLYLVEHARLGVMGASTAASGTLRLDDFVSRRWSYIGP
jgi:Matrixin